MRIVDDLIFWGVAVIALIVSVSLVLAFGKVVFGLMFIRSMFRDWKARQPTRRTTRRREPKGFDEILRKR